MIEIKQLNKIYPTKTGPFQALTDIHLTVHPGEIFGVIGKSGAGKSSLIRSINLLERPTSGSVCIDGKDLTQLSPPQLRDIRRQMGMIFQHFNLLSRRTVWENIILPLELMGKDRATIQRQAGPLLTLIGLEDKRDVYPYQLSGGQKQRVAIARALATQPKILLCDEMTSALDPQTTRSILQLIKSINQQLKLSILLITHEMEVIKQIADRVAVLDQGKIIEQSEVFELFTRPQAAMTRSLIQAALPMELPTSLKARLQAEPIMNGYAIWRFAFAGRIAAEPIIHDLIKNLTIELNILQANLEFIHEQALGVMIIAVRGENAELYRAKQYLADRGLRVETVGYIRNVSESIT